MRENCVNIDFLSKSENEFLSRAFVGSFALLADPTASEVADIKTAVSEAVTNAIVHGYKDETGIIYISCKLKDDELTVTVKDNGKGIDNVKKAMEPLYTTSEDTERSGMGFTVMETFMDTIKVDSIVGVGTKITMTKRIGRNRI